VTVVEDPRHEDILPHWLANDAFEMMENYDYNFPGIISAINATNDPLERLRVKTVNANIYIRNISTSLARPLGTHCRERSFRISSLLRSKQMGTACIML